MQPISSAPMQDVDMNSAIRVAYHNGNLDFVIKNSPPFLERVKCASIAIIYRSALDDKEALKFLLESQKLLDFLEMVASATELSEKTQSLGIKKLALQIKLYPETVRFNDSGERLDINEKKSESICDLLNRPLIAFLPAEYKKENKHKISYLLNKEKKVGGVRKRHPSKKKSVQPKVSPIARRHIIEVATSSDHTQSSFTAEQNNLITIEKVRELFRKAHYKAAIEQAHVLQRTTKDFSIWTEAWGIEHSAKEKLSEMSKIFSCINNNLK